MLRFKFALVSVALALASCSHSGSLPPTPIANSMHRAQAVSSDVLPPQSPWRFFPTASCGGCGIAQDRHSAWFFSSANSISNIDLSGSVTTFAVPLGGRNPVHTDDGAIWFIANDNSIGRLSARGSTAYFESGLSFPIGSLTAGFNNDVWFFVQHLANGFIGHLASDGTAASYQEEQNATCFGPLDCRPAGIARGPDGNMYIWFDGPIVFIPGSSPVGSFVERLNPATGATTDADLKSITSLGKMVVGPDERFWTIGTSDPDRTVPILVAIDTDFAATAYPLPKQSFEDITASRDAIYLLSGNAILRVNANGKVIRTSPFPSQIPCCASAISAAGPDNDVWFSTPNGIGVLRH